MNAKIPNESRAQKKVLVDPTKTQLCVLAK